MEQVTSTASFGTLGEADLFPGEALAVGVAAGCAPVAAAVSVAGLDPLQFGLQMLALTLQTLQLLLVLLVLAVVMTNALPLFSLVGLLVYLLPFSCLLMLTLPLLLL